MSRSHPAVPKSVLARWLCNVLGALALALLTVGHVLPVLHFTLVAHELCAEHGALHHVESTSVHANRRAASQRAVLPVAAAQHEHEHCGIVATAVERAVVPAAPACSSAFVAAHGVPAAPRSRVAHASLSLLDYAPKLAPPV